MRVFAYLHMVCAVLLVRGICVSRIVYASPQSCFCAVCCKVVCTWVAHGLCAAGCEFKSEGGRLFATLSQELLKIVGLGGHQFVFHDYPMAHRLERATCLRLS
jgi:hypothetical protein